MTWINSYLDFTEGMPAPRIYRLWAAISGVAGALERRCFTHTARSMLYPNMFVLLVGPPGVGKTQAIDPIEDLWTQGKKLKVAPSSVTKASLIDMLNKASRKIVINGGKGLLEYHSLQIAASELGVLIPSHDLEFLSVLTRIYDNPNVYSEERRTNNLSIEIMRPQLNILAGTQPGFLSSFMPEEAWSQGFTARTLMIYAGESPYVSLFGRQEPRTALKQELTLGFERMSTMMGPFTWSEEASSEMEGWARGGCQPQPSAAKLTHYLPRRSLHTIKLAMVATASRGESMTIELEDLEQARAWLLEAEALMPDIFKAMVQRSDAQLISELHAHLWRLWAPSKAPVSDMALWSFLKSRVPAERIPRIIDAATRSGVLSAVGPGFWTPRPKVDWGP